MERDVCDMMAVAGVPFNSRGYWYIREAVLMALEDRDVLMYVTKSLYPQIASKFNTTPCCVEKAIRSAIGKSWKVMSTMGNWPTMSGKRPTNSQYVSYLCEYVRMRNDSRI